MAAAVGAGALPPSPTSSAGTGQGQQTLKRRRKRTNLDMNQRAALDMYFQMDARPDHDKMAEIADSLQLDRDVSGLFFSMFRLFASGSATVARRNESSMRFRPLVRRCGQHVASHPLSRDPPRLVLSPSTRWTPRLPRSTSRVRRPPSDSPRSRHYSTESAHFPFNRFFPLHHLVADHIHASVFGSCCVVTIILFGLISGDCLVPTAGFHSGP